MTAHIIGIGDLKFSVYQEFEGAPLRVILKLPLQVDKESLDKYIRLDRKIYGGSVILYTRESSSDTWIPQYGEMQDMVTSAKSSKAEKELAPFVIQLLEEPRYRLILSSIQELFHNTPIVCSICVGCGRELNSDLIELYISGSVKEGIRNPQQFLLLGAKRANRAMHEAGLIDHII